MTRQRIITSLLLLLAALGVAALYVYNQREKARVGTGLYVPQTITITPEMLLLQEYVRIDTSNPPGNEIAGARWLAAQLRKGGVQPEIIESAPGRASVYARIRGRQSGEGLMLLSHIDVVPADPKQWMVPPFEGRISRNLLFGRGTLDMKGVAVCELLAFLGIARSGRPPEHDLVFLATADEEAGAHLGMRWLLEHRPEIFDGIRYVLNEGGATEMVEYKLTYIGIEIGSKIIMKVHLRAPRREQLQQARFALEPWFDSDRADRVLPEVRRFLGELAPRRVENRELLTDINRTIANGKLWLVPRPLRELTQNCLYPEGVQAAGGGYTMIVNLFNLPDETPEARIEWLRRLVAPYGVAVGEVEDAWGPVPFSSPDTPFFALLRSELQRSYGPVPVGTQILPWASTDCRFLRPRGIQCYGMWPFPVDVFQTKGIHALNEMMHLDWFEQGIRTMGSIVRRWAYPA